MIPSVSFAAEHYDNPLWKNLLLAGFPVVFFGVVIWAAIKLATKKANLANEQLIKQNAEIIKSLSEIAEILRSKP